MSTESTIISLSIPTAVGNRLDIEYEGENNLLVESLEHKNGRGGNEFIRMTLDEKTMLSHLKKVEPSIRDTDAYKKMDKNHACEVAEGFGSGDGASDEDRHAAWQYLVDTGLCWQLKDWYGKTAKDLIDQKWLEPSPKRVEK